MGFDTIEINLVYLSNLWGHNSPTVVSHQQNLVPCLACCKIESSWLLQQIITRLIMKRESFDIYNGLPAQTFRVCSTLNRQPLTLVKHSTGSSVVKQLTSQYLKLLIGRVTVSGSALSIGLDWTAKSLTPRNLLRTSLQEKTL